MNIQNNIIILSDHHWKKPHVTLSSLFLLLWRAKLMFVTSFFDLHRNQFGNNGLNIKKT